jgi:hypothetical protein
VGVVLIALTTRFLTADRPEARERRFDVLGASTVTDRRRPHGRRDVEPMIDEQDGVSRPSGRQDIQANPRFPPDLGRASPDR